MNNLKWVIVIAVAVGTAIAGYTVALLTPETGERIRSTLNVAHQQWHHGEVQNDVEMTEEEIQRRRADRLEIYLDQTMIDLGDSIHLLNSRDAEYQRAIERAELAEEIAEAVIQDHLSRPMLMLEPTPEEVPEDPEEPANNEISIGTQPDKQNSGT